MLLAYSSIGQSLKPYKGGKAVCPGCGTEVIAKCGASNVWHWAHESLDDCDNWSYEPTTFWHRQWQGFFHSEDTEVIVKKDSAFHIADILGNNNVVIEIQNSTITAEKIMERELFYEKMIWILNARRFGENLEIVGFSPNLSAGALRHHVEYEQPADFGKCKKIKITIPVNDDGAIENCLLADAKLFRQCEDFEGVFYVDDPELLNRGLYNGQYSYVLPKELRSAFSAYALHEQIGIRFPDDKEYYHVNFRWKHAKRGFSKSQMPIFLDLGPSFLLWLTKHNYANEFEGKIIRRQRFLNKYRIRKP